MPSFGFPLIRFEFHASDLVLSPKHHFASGGGNQTGRRAVWVSARRPILCRNAHAILIAPICLSRLADNFTTWGCHGQNHNLGPESPSGIADKREPVITLQAGPSGFLALHETDLRQGEHPAEEWLFEAPAPWFPMDAGMKIGRTQSMA
jgi:hypothetical protein